MTQKIILLTALLSGWAFAATETLELPHITVYGTAEIKVTPNEMIWSVNVKTENKELPTTATNHAAAVQKVLQFH